MGNNDGKALVLVTGASGYIAGHCVNELLEHGYRVRGTVRNLSDTRKTEHLHALAARHGTSIDLVQADLSRDDGWPQAVEGCTYVLHVASPFPAVMPDDENEIIRPAVDGTLRVLGACAEANARTAASIKRVVLTSSVAAIAFGHKDKEGHTFTEEDWTDPDNTEPYQKSKTLAERAAWDFVAGLDESRRFELAVINPGFVVGPLIGPTLGTSVEVVRRLLNRELPACPRIGWATVDVRDVALAHRLAMEVPEAAGKRFITAGDHMWMQDIGKILAEHYNPKGFRVPTGQLPYWLMWLAARFDKTVRMALPYVGKRENVSAARIRETLGWQPRDPRESFIDMAESMIELGVVKKPKGFRS